MTAIQARPGLFSGLAADFLGDLANVDVTFTIDGNLQPGSARGILRQARETDLADQGYGVAIEGITHRLSLAASDAEALQSGRDRVTIAGTTYTVRAIADDGRAMVKLLLGGDV